MRMPTTFPAPPPLVLCSVSDARHWLRLLAVVLALALPAFAQCAYQPMPSGVVGASGEVRSSAYWDPDGAGPATRRIVYGGAFVSIGTVTTRGIAAYDPATGAWSSFGSGLTYGPNPGETAVTALVGMPNGDLVAAGRFTQAGSVAAHYIARWDGTAWSPLGSGLVELTSPASTDVYALAALPNGDVVAGGYFTSAGGVAVNGIALWNGVAWSAMAGGVTLPSSGSGEVRALLVEPNGDLLVGGTFLVAGGIPTSGLARWNGGWSAQQSLPGFTSAFVRAAAHAPNGGLAAVWRYPGSQGYEEGVFRWNGVAWVGLGTLQHPLGPTDVGGITVLTNGDIVVTGHFASIGGIQGNGIARWNGLAWSQFGVGIARSPNVPIGYTVIEVGNGLLALGGGFQTAGNAGPNIAYWSGGAWGNLPAFLANNFVNCSIVEPDGSLVVGGRFTSIGGIQANRVARWNGTTWQALGAGISGAPQSSTSEVRAVARLADGSLVVGGLFQQAGSVAVTNIARWDGVAWSALGPGIGGLVGVEAVAGLPNGEVVAAGSFNNGTGQIGIARWNGTAWTSFGAGFFNPVWSLAVAADGALLAGGAIYGGLQRWDGTSWSIPGGGVFAANTGTVRTVAVLADGSVAVGGVFAAPAGTTSPNVARWDGSSWHGYGNGLQAPDRLAALPDGSVVALSTNYLLRWSGAAFTPVANVSGARTAVARADGELYLGGSFATVNGVAAPRLARFQPGCPAAAGPGGAGCAGPNGPLVLTAESLPWLGGPLHTRCSGFANGDLGLAMLGTTPAAIPLAAIHPSGGTGCMLWSSGEVIEFLVPTAGAVDWQWRVPTATALVGATWLHQVLLGTFSSPTTLTGLFGSNSLQLRVGAL